jgi:hypothetical protein
MYPAPLAVFTTTPALFDSLNSAIANSVGEDGTFYPNQLTNRFGRVKINPRVP